MYLAQSLPFLSKCALENGLPVLLGTAVSKKFKTPYFTPIGSHCVTPDKRTYESSDVGTHPLLIGNILPVV